ncbi:hypothetical protein GCK32_020720, partial [Trichostrongylus colubriformis]
CVPSSQMHSTVVSRIHLNQGRHLHQRCDAN